MKRHAMAIRRPPSHPLHRIQRRRTWAAFKTFAGHVAAVILTFCTVGLFYAYIVLVGAMFPR